MCTISITTSHTNQLLDITDDVRKAVEQIDISRGICHVHCLHTTAALTINENADPAVVKDMLLSLNTIVKVLPEFTHAEGNSAAHVKSSLLGNSVTVPIDKGTLVLGTWQGIYFCEFDGPRNRRVTLTCTPA